MIRITGANGFVGHRLMETVTDAIAAPSLRNATQEDIKRIIEESGADTIIHTAAISDIGVCQSDPEESYLANVRLPLWIAQASAGRKLICFSSDQVYSGSDDDGPYTEEMVAPGNVYAAHKLEMEQRVLDCLPGAVILRAEWMYDRIWRSIFPHVWKQRKKKRIKNAECIVFCSAGFIFRSGSSGIWRDAVPKGSGYADCLVAVSGRKRPPERLSGCPWHHRPADTAVQSV